MGMAGEAMRGISVNEGWNAVVDTEELRERAAMVKRNMDFDVFRLT